MDLSRLSPSFTPQTVEIAWKGFGSPGDRLRPRDANGRPADKWAAPRAKEQDFDQWERLEKASITPQTGKIHPTARDVATKLLFVSIKDDSSDVRLAARTLLNRLEESSAGFGAAERGPWADRQARISSAAKTLAEDEKAANRFLNGYFHRPIGG
jgi:hypothetical protein